ncbi:MBOAT family O-acyltransferase [Thermoproteota archaeon]
MLLVASYIFYGAWNWKFLSLILISTILDYVCGLKIYESRGLHKRKLFLFFSIFGNLAILGFFKYFNFFAANLQLLFNRLGLPIEPRFLHIILPVGISFYTFQTMSYTIDIYRKQMEPTRKFFDFALFVAFFPQLVAGPIERAKRLLPQILSPRRFRLDYFYEGVFLILWGLYQKVFIADNLAKIVDPIFASSYPYNGVQVLLATYAFAIQIFCDFAGYSNIARGLGRVMGFDIMVNFNLPYFAVNPSDFWRRWHISLSTWLKDYLYIPLGGNKKGALATYRNLALTMILGGLWHGAAWTFVAWGAYHGILLIFYRTSKFLRNIITLPKGTLIKKLSFIIRVLFFFHLVCLGWIIFRAQSLTQAVYMIHSLFFNFSIIRGFGLGYAIRSIVFFGYILFVMQVFQYMRNDLFAIFKFKPLFQISFYLIILFSILFMGVATGEEFIYFQF